MRNTLPSDALGPLPPPPGSLYPPAGPLMPVGPRPATIPLSEQEFYRLQEIERRYVIDGSMSLIEYLGVTCV